MSDITDFIVSGLITVNRQEYHDKVPFPDLIANKTLELVYENAPERTILK